MPVFISENQTFVAPWVDMDDDVLIHPFAYIGKLPSQSLSLARNTTVVRELHIGAGTEIGPHAVIYGGVDIGEKCLIGDGANIREGVKIGNRCIIGAHVTINYDALLHDEVRIMNGTHITGGCRIGRGAFIGCNVSTMNDRRRTVVEYQFKGASPPIIGARCLIGSGACILPGITIGIGAVVAAGAIVLDHVPPNGVVKAQRTV